MSNSTIARIAVRDHLDQLILEAELRLRPLVEGSPRGRSRKLRYLDNLGVYSSDEVPAGDYLLSVTAKGYEKQQIRLRLSGRETYDEVMMGRKGLPSTLHNGRRVYYEFDGEKTAALVRESNLETGVQARSSGAFSNLRALATPIERGGSAVRGLLIFDRPQVARTADAASLNDQLEAAPEVLDAGPLVRTDSWPPKFISRFIELVTDEGLARDRLAALIEPFGLAIHYRDSHEPTYYLLRSDAVPGPEIVALPERLMGLDGIRAAGIRLMAPVETTQPFVPGDPDFALQFHAYITRLPEAWHQLDAANRPQSLGSADVIVAVHDNGIRTSGPGFAVSHPEFSGLVAGGTLSARPGLNSAKVLSTFDFSSVPMGPGNNSSNSVHGSWVAGVISAASDGTAGGAGGAANTRLCSYMFSGFGVKMANAFELMAGIDPRWQLEIDYTDKEPFPAPGGTGRRPLPGADIINCSHTHDVMIELPMRNALQRITLFGRRRRGTLVFASAGNQDKNTRETGRWGENSNVMRVSASSLDLLGEEVRMNYSSFARVMDPAVDFAAPSTSHNVLTRIHQPPKMFGLISTHRRTTSGDLRMNVAARANLTQTPPPNANSVRVPAASLAAFGGGGQIQVIIRSRTNPFFSELHVVAGTTAPDVVNLSRSLGYSYTAPDAEIIRLTGRGYSTRFGGTSAAAPQASAIAALMLSANPALSWLEVRDLMRRTAVPINLRHRGSIYGAGDAFRYRWLDPEKNDLITFRGLLDVTDSTAVSAGPPQRGERFLTLDSAAGIEPGQSLLIGAETTLDGTHPRPPFTADTLFVDSSDGFEAGDPVFIGRASQTVLIDAHVANDTILWVQSVDGFLPGDEITLGSGNDAETVQITSIQRMSSANAQQPASFSGDAESGLAITPALTKVHARTTTVTIAASQREGPFKVDGVGFGKLILDAPLIHKHPGGRLVRKANSEIKAIIQVFDADNRVEIDPLDFDHPFNASGIEPVGIGRVASYSLAFGYGRLDAFEAVKAAQDYTHDERDLIIRNFLDDDGVTNTGNQEVDSPDIWVQNDQAATIVDLPEYGKAGPHQHPQVTVDPAIFIGSGLHDLEVSGACTSLAEVTLTITIDATSTPDSFKWSKDGGAATAGVAVTGAAQALSDGVSIRFAATTGHTLGDKWIVKARKIDSRFLHVRFRNRGTRAFFSRADSNPADTWGAMVPPIGGKPPALDVARSRLLLCLSDGLPVCRFSSVAKTPGTDDLEVVSAYTGASPRALYTVEIIATAPGDTFRRYRDGTRHPDDTILTAGALNHDLGDGVRVRFGSATGHKIGDRWDIYARSGAGAFLNLDHYWEIDEPTPFDLAATDRTGTRILRESAIDGLGASFDENGTEIFDTDGHQIFDIDYAAWPEEWRPPTNSPNRPPHGRPVQLFALGEVVPHDGALNGFTAETNNNFSFRELIFADLRLTRDDGESELERHIDLIDGKSESRGFRIGVRTTAGTFAAERVRIRLTARKQGGLVEVRTFAFDADHGVWQFTPSDPAWATLAPPLEAGRPDGTRPVAAGEQFDITFDGTYTVDKSFDQLEIEAQILSSFRELVIARASHIVNVYEIAALPKGVGLAEELNLPAPESFVFADMAHLTQNAQLAYGPVAGSEETRYRTTSLFRASAEVKAYAVTTSFVLLQRDPENTRTVNLILRPFKQPAPRFTPIRYFIYRGLRLKDFLEGPSRAREKRIRPREMASDFIQQTWDIFLKLNPGAAEMPSTVLGYDRDRQTDEDKLEDSFFRIGSDMQLPVAGKGVFLGRFRHTNNHEFGFEIVFETAEPDLGYARLPSHEIEPAGTDSTRLDYRIQYDRILDYMDPAAFYGLHLHTDSKLQADGQPGFLTPQEIYDQVLARFHTRHTLYVDVRSENSSSLNFYRNYGTSDDEQIQVGDAPGSLTAQAYTTHGWPILILDRSADVDTEEEYHEVYLRLRIDDNKKPVLYVDHGQLLTPATRGRFVRGDDIHTGTAAWTEAQGFRFPNTGPAGSRKGVAWPLRLIYGRLEDPEFPDTVLKTEKYTDNVFGPIDRRGPWTGDAGLQWFTAQDKRYVDADDDLGWKQMMTCGIARETGGTERVLLYAAIDDSDTNETFDTDEGTFVRVRPIADGVSQRGNFFDTRGLFGAYLLEHDQIDDDSVEIRTLELRLDPVEAYPPTNALLLGLEKDQLETLQALAGQGISSDYLRNVLLDDKTPQVSTSGRSYDRYRLGIQGLEAASGEYRTEFPATDLHVYTVDGQFFYTPAFSKAEPLPTVYPRNYEEEKGIRERPARERRIAGVDVGADTITIEGFDWTREIVPGDTIKIDKSQANDGKYPVSAVALAAGDTVITLGAPGIANDQRPLGSVFTLPKANEDFFIDLDRAAAIDGIPKTRDLVDGFAADLAAIANNNAALDALRDKVDEVAPQILRRAQLLAQSDRGRADDHERTLYWARLRMLVELKKHPFCLASVPGRNELVDLFENGSRGYAADFAAAPAGAKKVLITGFDPFQLDRSLDQSNPSASAALALHRRTFSSSGQNAYVESAVFPVRYRDFDAEAVEELVTPFLDGTRPIDMIVTLSLNSGDDFHDVERFAGRRRAGYPDNEFVRQRPRQLGKDATHDPFYESTLPASAMVTDTSTAPDQQILFFDQSYGATTSDEKHPRDGGPYDNQPTFPITDVTGNAVKGSGGSYLSNEIFYRVARIREQHGRQALTGHFHILDPKQSGATVEQIIEAVEKLITDWLDSL